MRDNEFRPAFRFVTLGRLALLAEPGGTEVPGTQRRKLALLALLALARRPLTRDALVEMFWGDEDEERARHSLSNALSYLRRILGPDSIAFRRAEVTLASETPIAVDARDLLRAAEAGDHARAIALYGGPFLDGVYIPGSDSFDEWVSSERARIEIAFTKACDAECMASARRGEWEHCAEVARRWLDVAPLSPEAALHLLNSLRAAKTPAGRRAALAEYRRLVDRLAREYNAPPHARVVALAEQIAARVEADRVAAAESVDAHVDAHVDESAGAVANSQASTQETEPSASDIERAAPPEPIPVPSVNAPASTPISRALAPSITSPSRRRRWRRPGLLIGLGVAAAAAAAAILGIAHGHVTNATAAATRPLIAVTDIANLRGDTASAWLEDGLVQMISADLERSPDVEVVTPGRVRDTRARAEVPLTGALTQDAALGIAGRLGATLAVRGAFTHGPGTYVLDVDLRDVASGRTVRSFTVSGTDPMALADQVAGHILAWSSARDTRPHFSEIETSNVAAYQHFVRALQADAEGRFADSRRESDAAIALDSGFASAITLRISCARREGDGATMARLERAMRHARLGTWDILSQAIDSAQHNGEMTRAEQLARALVARYPHDPRSYSMLAGLYELQGDWGEFERTLQRQLELDSLADEAGNGPCVPCSAYNSLVEGRMYRGDLTGAEDAARRWIRLQPDLPGAWAALAAPLSYRGRFDAALDAERRALMLSGDDPLYSLRTARALVLARRFDVADSLARTWRDASDQDLREGATDIHVLVLRERGQLRESVRATQAYLASNPYDDALAYEEFDALGRLGDYAAASRAFDVLVGQSEAARTASQGLLGDRARWFTWTRALGANAIAGGGDTVRLHAIADSMRVIAARSYYARDPRLYHHVLGLIAMQGHRYAEAEREFQAARWGPAGWTETVAWLARAQLAQGHTSDAIASLREAYEGPLDAMGRYEPRSELDYLMALAFTRAGNRDSAAVYGGYARRAWRGADPEVKRLLAAL